MAGRDWLHTFMTRNNISIRKPEATSINRITAFNKTEISSFFELLGQLMEKHRFVAKNIYNCDETGISTVQTPGKLLATKGQKKVGSITSWERGKSITLLCAMGIFLFPSKSETSATTKPKTTSGQQTEDNAPSTSSVEIGAEFVSSEFSDQPSTSRISVTSVSQPAQTISKCSDTLDSTQVAKRSHQLKLDGGKSTKDLTELQRREFDLSLLKLIVKDFQPLSLVENSGFWNIAKN
ncbi:hypothetical protein NQ318_009117 [Aromia moschata]|uniref:HTH CENPB-type domain-containing protein n=1 Tax=Aromia moschata TaxID=1265417 RepID=A0AAV8XPA0_9CUCU|nr:hypothetical protein NQ318_009117 [Aromia moschata]